MAQEFTIKSQDIEDKINQLLPSQGGFQPGVDFSASTMVIPIVDLTETAEGSSLRQDLQSSFSYNQVTSFSVNNTLSTLVTTTGYYRVFGNIQMLNENTATRFAHFYLYDGVTYKSVLQVASVTNSGLNSVTSTPVDFIVKLDAGISLVAFSNDTFSQITGSTRQLADLQGNLTNP
jgi:hypothetical protein